MSNTCSNTKIFSAFFLFPKLDALFECIPKDSHNNAVISYIETIYLVHYTEYIYNTPELITFHPALVWAFPMEDTDIVE